MSVEDYEIVIGLEVHAELKTSSKLFCSCSTAFGAPPNTQCCPVCIGLPGTLPVWNRRAVELAALAGLALNCTVEQFSRAERKQYFYPDLPKAYQISQGDLPLCKNGGIAISVGKEERYVGISRIHIEEDAGKLIHRDRHTLIDGNRCGIPLIEIVSEPDLRSGEEAAAYLRALRGVLVACDISDCKMQEGSLRCDINLSVRKKGSDGLGVRTEIKNLNSFAFAEKAIAYEAKRQVALLEAGGQVQMETRRFDPATGETILMRVKESSEDYRFLIEPDLPPLRFSKEEIEALRGMLPELPKARKARLMDTFDLPAQAAEVLISDGALADYFEEAAAQTSHPVLLANLLLTDVLRLSQGESFFAPVSVGQLAELAQLLGEGTVNSATAKKLLPRLLDSDVSPRELVSREGLAQICDEGILRKYVEDVLVQNPRAVSDYKNGKKAAMQALQGRLMAMTAGRADPQRSARLLLAALDETKELRKDDKYV